MLWIWKISGFFTFEYVWMNAMEIRIIIPKEVKSTLRVVSAESPTPLKDTMLLSVRITRHGGSSTKKYLIILPIVVAFIVSKAPSISMNLPLKIRLIAPAAAQQIGELPYLAS